MKTAEANTIWPAGLHYAYWFAFFNALSFQIVLSSPMVLFAKYLEANATVLGIIAGMMPLLVVFQIPAAKYVERVGCKRFVYAGWGTRVMFIFGMAMVPLAQRWISSQAQLAVLLALLFGFNLSRGISSAGWLPWISALVPAEVRGVYLARDAACVNIASFATFVLAALCLGGKPTPWQFVVLFGFSAVMGAASLQFLKRIPEANPPGPAQSSSHPIPWMAMIRFDPFLRLLKMVVAWSIAYGGLTTFTVAFLKSEAGFSEGLILLLASVSFLGGLGSLWFLGSRLDHLGSKPVLTFSFAVWILIVLGWGLIAGKIFAPSILSVIILQLLMGLFAALVQMSNTRLAMEVVPMMGRNHFFALYSVFGSLALGLSPILWGLMIDALADLHTQSMGLEWNRYTVFFVAVSVAFLLTLALSRELTEPKATSFENLVRDVFWGTPVRLWARLWPR